MNRILILSIALLLGGHLTTTQAQSSSDGPHPAYSNILKISPAGFSRSYFELVYERYLPSRTKSLLVSSTFMLKESGFESFRGAQLMGQFRIYLNNVHKSQGSTWFFENLGYYAAPIVSGLTYSEDFRLFIYDEVLDEGMEMDFKKEVKAAEAGVVMGIQFHLTPRFVLDLFAGGGIRYADETDNIPEEIRPEFYQNFYDVLDIEYTGIKPMGGFHVGFTF